MSLKNTPFELSLELDGILGDNAETVIDRVRRAGKAFLAETDKSFVLFGAGPLGKRTLAALRTIGIEPRAFADNNPKLWDESVQGLQVMSPTKAANLYRNEAVFVATVYTNRPVIRQMQDMQLRFLTFPALAWIYPALLPHGAVAYPNAIFGEANDVMNAFSLWADDESRREYLAQIKWRTSLDANVLPPHLPLEQIYFPEDLFTWSANEVLVDCGAFDGDTVREVLTRCGSAFSQIIALEPDPANLARLNSFLATLPPKLRRKVTAMNFAAAASRTLAWLDSTGTGLSVVGSGATEIVCAPLDEILAKCSPTFVKMDIEGSEPEALAGARRVIQQHAPVLAVCLYHRQSDLWRIPLLIREMTARYSFYLRRYSDDCWELVLYAIPHERVLHGK